MSRRIVSLVAVLVLAMGITYPFSTGSSLTHDSSNVEVPFGIHDAGVTSIGANATNASVTLTRSTTLTTTNVLYLNNTNASAPYYAKITLYASSGAVNRITTGVFGISNGVANPQVVISSGTITQSSGSYVTLAPSSTNRIYVTQQFANTGGTDPTFSMIVTLADETNESAYSVTRWALDLV